MFKITLGVEGMACGMCEAHINDAVRNAFPVKKVTSSHIKKQTVILTQQELPEQELKSIIAGAGYEVVSVRSEPYEKKGGYRVGLGSLFNIFKKILDKSKIL